MASRIIAFQGRPGAYSDLACRTMYPDWKTLPCLSFAEAIQAVKEGQARLAMLACENSLAGRVPDIHVLLPQSGLFIVGEHFQRIEHCLLGVPGAHIKDIKRIHTHPVAMGQVRHLLEQLHVEPVVESDTAGAAESVAKWANKEDAAIASSLAGELYGLEILQRNVEDAAHNTTRFYVVSKEEDDSAASAERNTQQMMTTILFRSENIPSALYKALGGFATNGVNITRIESYMIDGNFVSSQFLIDVEGSPESPHLRQALDELVFFSDQVKVLGAYPASRFRSSTPGSAV
ncbi:prephenate dehydratase [Entomobacter blattae]|uniref:prephenate dehydratase n=1 Tax=Entomobacter blattae TaxID=2762277 RepID=A0A7H1NSI9_9PROT|nr:prephenate dehydratase [Entomobacter blattae]QNT78749.1 P-protein [Entomobacter blattae]